MTAVPIPPEPQPEDMPEQVDMSDPEYLIAFWAWKARLDRRNLREDLPGGDL